MAAKKPGRKVKVTLRKVTRKNLTQVLKLEVAKGQEKFVAANAVSIAQGCFEKAAWFRAIYAGETPVGFVMMYENRKLGKYYLWRFMIDGKHQGKGYGKRALTLIIDRVRKSPRAKNLTLCFLRGRGGPERFYERLGFKDTGKIKYGEHLAKLVLRK
ncbi:MAG: GNAT family N-acetyltransferase [Euryarchaeota archaeon]|nr:GNAT family N-acetyltransferase [Euryarchaeota archaeon]